MHKLIFNAKKTYMREIKKRYNHENHVVVTTTRLL